MSPRYLYQLRISINRRYKSNPDHSSQQVLNLSHLPSLTSLHICAWIIRVESLTANIKSYALPYFAIALVSGAGESRVTVFVDVVKAIDGRGKEVRMCDYWQNLNFKLQKS